jgi:hypothetical protein
MAKQKHPRYYSRKFLNKSKGTALIESSVDISPYSMDGTICISDCYRKVELDMHIYDKKSLKEKYDKLELLIKELTLFKDFIDNNADYYFELKKNNKPNSLAALLSEEDDDD